ncbi:Iron Transport-associated domain-containing protein [Geosporobacter subterraneus DSM 17957]|uniref:Iron Transport-associated domain-containing protein n=1 Tax=Geosporobacter subterraneus DSM 17957 TaxID=1121919 RepID=A0A1M6PMY7_9FIRM|nr:NEAT domain-containing protein [Geosporobacter subterraneus]SHK09258.1 Iron Transport-associated domain-containing protein [Geosporobacter subterraneus DSM 17957]
MFKKIKEFICFALLIFALMVPTVASGAGNIPDGKYAIGATSISASSDEVSRLNNSLVNPLNVVVEKGKINVYLTLSRPTKELNTLKISSDGGKNFTEAAVVSSSESATQYMFSVDHLDEPLFATIYVNAMGATPLFRIAFDKSDVEKMKSATAVEKPKQEQPAQEAAPKAAPQQEKKTSDQKPAAVETAATPAVQKQTAVEQPPVTEMKETEDQETTEEKETETSAEETQAEENLTEKSSDEDEKTGSSKMIFVMGTIVGLIVIVAGKKYY